ncbi:MAG: flavin-containing amine oxidase [Burkholderiales bacterium]|jgi:monoamine oxidase|nr:flavin-containing amine oxidase [Burkholderiales bacterium]
MNRNAKVIVIGAGAAGSYCGYLLDREGFNVTILEAHDRVGGRTYSVDNVDLGGSWVSTQQPNVYALCKKLGLELIPQYDSGSTVSVFNGVRSLIPGGLATIMQDTNVKSLEVIETFEKWSRDLNFEDKFFLEMDQISAEKWLKQNIKDSDIIDYFLTLIGGITTTHPDKLSMLFWLYFLRQGRGIRCLSEIKDAAQEFRINGGAQTISLKLTKDLDVKLNQCVVEVKNQENGQYQVITQDNNVYIADLVVCAVPANLINNIKFNPGLEPGRTHLYNGMHMGCVTKVVVLYDRPFWREAGLTGTCFSTQSPISACFDGSGDGYFAIISFIPHIEDNPKEYTDEEILLQLSQFFDNKQALTPVKIYRKDWRGEKYARGCYFSAPRIGDAGLYKYLTRPNKNIYFIGTETANEWYGYIDGAIESAKRAFNQIKFDFSKGMV